MLSIVPSKQDNPPLVYEGEGEVSTWRRSLSSGGRGAPHTCSVGSANMPWQNEEWEQQYYTQCH